MSDQRLHRGHRSPDADGPTLVIESSMVWLIIVSVAHIPLYLCLFCLADKIIRAFHHHVPICPIIYNYSFMSLSSEVPLCVVFLEDNYKLPDAIPYYLYFSSTTWVITDQSGLIATDATVIGFKAACVVSAPVRGWRWT